MVNILLKINPIIHKKSVQLHSQLKLSLFIIAQFETDETVLSLIRLMINFYK